MANSVDPDQILQSSICSESTLFTQACQSLYLGLLLYVSFMISLYILGASITIPVQNNAQQSATSNTQTVYRIPQPQQMIASELSFICAR